jgi:hypothetical protein
MKMSRWRNVNPASYAPKSDNLGELAQGFADVFVPTYLKKKALEEQRAYDEEKARKARAAAAAKEAKKQEEKDAKIARNAKILMKQYSNSDNNREALEFFTQQLQLMDGDVGNVMSVTENMIQDGRLEFVTRDVEKPLQGPDVPSDFETSLTVGDTTYDEMKGGDPLTVGDLGAISESENNSDAIRDEAGQMAEVFAPVSEEPAIPLPTEGIKITPLGKKAPEIDASFLKANASTQELADVTIAKLREQGFEDEANVVEGYAKGAFKKQDLSMQDINALGDVGRNVALNDTSGRFTETDKANIRLWNETEGKQKKDEALKELRGKSEDALNDVVNSAASTEDERKEAAALLAGRSQEPFKIEDYDDVKDIAVLEIARDQAPKDSDKRAQLTALIKARTAAEAGAMPELNLDGGFFMTTYKITDENGETVTVMSTTAPSAQGIYDIENRRLVPPDAITRNDSMKTLGDMADLVAQANDKTLKPVREARSQTATMLESARRLESFVDPKQGGNPAILTTVGGDVTKLIDRLGNEYEALNNLYLSGADNETVMQYIDNQASQFAETASMSSQFQAELLKFAYTYASAVLEQRGTGLSNNDFKKALQIVSAGSSYETFSNNLRSQSLQRINTVSRKISDLDTEPQIVLLDRYDPELTRGFKVPMPDYLASRGLGDMVEWANGKAEKVATDDTLTPPEVKNKTVGTKISGWRQGNTFNGDYKTYADMPENLRDSWATVVANTQGIPKQAVLDAFAAQAKAAKAEQGQ